MTKEAPNLELTVLSEKETLDVINQKLAPFFVIFAFSSNSDRPVPDKILIIHFLIEAANCVKICFFDPQGNGDEVLINRYLYNNEDQQWNPTADLAQQNFAEKYGQGSENFLTAFVSAIEKSSWKVFKLARQSSQLNSSFSMVSMP